MIRREYSSIGSPFSNTGIEYRIEIETDDYNLYSELIKYSEIKIQDCEQSDFDLEIENNCCDATDNDRDSCDRTVYSE